MAYRAEIEIGVKGIKDLHNTQAKIERLSRQVDEANKKPLFNKAVVANLQTYNAVLAKANKTLNKTQIELDSAGNAVNNYKKAINNVVTAQFDANEASRITSRLLKEEVANRNAATTAVRSQVEANIRLSKASREASNFGAGLDPVAKSIARRRKKLAGDPSAYAGPIGPALSELQGQSSPVAERLSQQLRDQAKLKASLLALDEKSAAAAQERLNLSTQLKEELNDIKVAAKTGPREPEGFSKAAGQRKVDDSVRRQQIMKEGADFVAQQEANRKATIESYNKVAQFAKKNEATVFGIRAKNTRRALDLEFDKIAKQAAAEGKAADKLVAKRISDINEVGKAFDKELNRRIKAKEKAAENERKNQKRTTDAGRKRRNDAISSGLIGGAFPLLFGQGIGAAAGGGIGGAVGGAMGGQMGFALSLVGTQFGAFADQIVSGGATLGQALNLVTADLEAVAAAAGYANTEIGDSLGVIQKLGSEQQALQLATELLAATVGNEGVQALQEFGADTLELSNAFSRAMALMQAAAAQLFGSIAKLAAGAVSDAVDLESGLRNVDDPRLKDLKKERESLQTDDGEGAFVGENTEENLKRIREINREIIDIVKANRTEVEKKVKAEAAGLQNAQALSKFGESDIKRQKIKNALAGVERDFTDDNFVSLQRQLIQRDKELDLEKAKAIVGKDINGNTKNYGLLAQLNAQITQNSLNEENKLNRDIAKAIESKNKKTAQGSAQLDRQNKQLSQQAQQAQAFTSNLERQLAQSKAAGTLEAKKLRIEQTYEQTIERISKLKNQDYAVEQTALADQIKTSQSANLDLEQAKKQAEAVRQAVEPLTRIRESQEASLATSKEYNRLLMEGVLPSEAKRITNFNAQVDALLRQKEVQISILETDLLRSELSDKQIADTERQIKLLKLQKGEIETEAAKGPSKSDTSDRKTIEDRVAQLKGELTELTKLGNIAVTVADNIGSAFSTAFQSVINGSQTMQEALAGMLKSVGESFVAMAAEIIVKQLTMIALQAVLKALGGPSFGTGGGSDLGSDAADPGSGLRITEVAKYMGGKANGGPVSGGHPYLIGERGPEMFVPGQSGGVMSNEDMRSLMGRSPAASNSPAMNFSFETTNIGGTDYVSREQLEAAMAVTRKDAARDGAKRGMNMTLDKMQHSPSTRRRVGI